MKGEQSWTGSRSQASLANCILTKVAATVRYLEMELPTRNAALKTNLDLVNKQLSKRQLSYVTLEDETMA